MPGSSIHQPDSGKLVPGESAEKTNGHRLDALRYAVNVKVADIEAGRYRTFESGESLREGLSAMTSETINACRSDSRG